MSKLEQKIDSYLQNLRYEQIVSRSFFKFQLLNFTQELLKDIFNLLEESDGYKLKEILGSLRKEYLESEKQI